MRGYGKTPGIDAVVVVLDSDRRNCAEFLAELKALAAGCNLSPNTLFRLAIEKWKPGISETGMHYRQPTHVPRPMC